MSKLDYKTLSFFSFLVATVSVPVLPASAAPTLVVSGGVLLGANDIDVNGQSFDVRFLDGTCIELFSGCDSPSDFTFPTQASALAAAQALAATVLIDGPDGLFDTQYQLTNGCVVNTVQGGLCAIWTPFSITVNGIDVAGAINFGIESQDRIASAPELANLNYAQFSYATYAVFGDFSTISSVPAPMSSLLLMSAIFGAGVWRMREYHLSAEGKLRR